MKKFFDKLTESLCGAAVYLLLCSPILIAVVLFFVFNWEHMPVILSKIAYFGDGSLFWGILICLFGIIGLINTVAAFYMWLHAVAGWMEKKLKSYFLFVILIVIATIGFDALFEIIKKL